MKQKVLIVDDDPVQLRLLEGILSKFGYDCSSVNNGEACLERLATLDNQPDLILLDLVMPDLDGMAVLERMRKNGAQTPVIVQTSQGGIDTVVSAMRAGAVDFVVKPVSPERLRVSVENALRIDSLQNELERVKRSVSGKLTFKDVISTAPRMKRVLDLAKRAASSTIPILLEGETGVGKEMIARAIQGSSKRQSKPFVTVNCGAIPENLVESILFGHEKGAFTGATEKKIGKFKEAHGGTLFLDEVGELPLDLQVKLLRAIQEGEIDPVGSRKTEKIDIRIISATNRSLLDMVKEGSFREDLYYRLNVFPIVIPPLRQRADDIPHLAKHFAARFAAEEGRRHLRGLSQEALELLMQQDWPGNIRQLENMIFRAVVLCDGDQLTPLEFPQLEATNGTKHSRSSTASSFQETKSSTFKENAAPPCDAAPVTDEDMQDAVMRLLDLSDNVRPLGDLEAEVIRKAYSHYDGHISLMSRKLGIGRSTLYRKMREYNIGDPEPSERSQGNLEPPLKMKQNHNTS